MAKNPDPAQMLSAWKSGMAGGQQKYKAGIMGCQVNPMALAAAKVTDGTYLAAVSDAVNSGRMVQRLNAVDVGFWKAQASGAGATAWAAGAAKGAPKYQKVAAQLAQAAAAGSAAAAGVSGTMAKIQANINAFKAAFGRPAI